jgi:hypothetical protein
MSPLGGPKAKEGLQQVYSWLVEGRVILEILG